MSEPTNQPLSQEFSLADAAHAAQQPVEVVQAHLGGPQAPAVLNEAGLVALLQHFGRLPAGPTIGFWLTYEHLGLALNRQASLMHKRLPQLLPGEPSGTRGFPGKPGRYSTSFDTSTLIKLLRHYNFLPSAEFREFSATAITITRELARQGHVRHSENRVRAILTASSLERRRLLRPEFRRGRPQPSFRPAEAMELLANRRTYQPRAN